MKLKKFINKYGFKKQASRYKDLSVWDSIMNHEVHNVVIFGNGYEFDHNGCRYRVYTKLLGVYPFYCVEREEDGRYANITGREPSEAAWIGTMLVDRARN